MEDENEVILSDYDTTDEITFRSVEEVVGDFREKIECLTGNVMRFGDNFVLFKREEGSFMLIPYSQIIFIYPRGDGHFPLSF